eukprot:gene17200-biopygen20353
MPNTVQEWHAEEVIFEAFRRILQACWPPKLAKSGLKDAPQRRGYTRSLPMDRIDERRDLTGVTQKAQEIIKIQEITSDTVKEWPTQQTQGIIKNAGNHAGCRPGMACRGCHFWSILENVISILDSKTSQSGLKDAAATGIPVRSQWITLMVHMGCTKNGIFTFHPSVC